MHYSLLPRGWGDGTADDAEATVKFSFPTLLDGWTGAVRRHRKLK